MYKAAIFDLDGTLINSLYDLGDSVNYALTQLGAPKHTYDEICSYIGNGADTLLKRALPADMQDLSGTALGIFTQYYGENMLNKTLPYDGMIDLLKKAKQNGIKTAVVSNKPDYAAKHICDELFGSLIDYTIGSDPENRPKKPNPDSVYKALEVLKAEKSEAIYIGDSDIDVETAKNSGLKSIGVTWGFRSVDLIKDADYIADTPEDIAAVLLDKPLK